MPITQPTVQPTVHPTEPTKPVFGVYEAPFDGEIYQVSRTGIVYYPPTRYNKPVDPTARPQVLSFVNGSMCVNPIGDFIFAGNFDGEAVLILTKHQYHIGRGELYNELPIAYFDPVSNTYTTTEPAWHQEQFKL
jgi:hypothetical protein